MTDPNNYTLGRGELWFAKYLAGTQLSNGERYIGNTPEFAANIENENLDHFNSDRGIKEKDESIPLQTNRTASFITDNIHPENLAMYFLGETSKLAVTAASVVGERHEAVIKGLTYQLGKTGSGARNLDIQSAGVNIIVNDDKGAPTTYVEGSDYTIDMERGRLEILSTGNIDSGTNLVIDYKVKATTRDRVISGSKPIEGSLRYLSFNPAGKQFDWFMPWVKIQANGDHALKGDEWQQIPFSVEILRKPGWEAVYIDGEPLVA
jgi:hypothetical protein